MLDDMPLRSIQMLCRLTVLLHEAMCEGTHPQASFVDRCDRRVCVVNCLALRCRVLALLRTRREIASDLVRH